MPDSDDTVVLKGRRSGGVWMSATLLHEMRRREARFGLETMCTGGGQDLAAMFERVV